MAGETVNVFFVALKKLAVLFGGLPEWTFVHSRTPGEGETTTEGIHNHQGNTNWAITWACTGHCQGWSRTGEPVVMAMQVAILIPQGWTHKLGWIASTVDGLVTSQRIAQTKDMVAYTASNMASTYPGNQSRDKMSARRNQSSEYTLTKCLPRCFLIQAALTMVWEQGCTIPGARGPLKWPWMVRHKRAVE